MERSTVGILGVMAVLALSACGAEGGDTRVDAAGAPPTETAPQGQGSAAGDSAAGVQPEGGAPDASPGGLPALATASGAAPAAQAPAAQAPAPAETREDAAAILRRAEVAYDALRSLEADFTQDLSVPLLGSSQRSRGKLYIRRPDRFLMRFTDPSGDVVVADGRYLWLYYPSSDPKQVIRTSVGAGGQQIDFQKEFLSDPLARFNAVLNGVESAAGRPAHLLTLTPRAASPYRQVRIWVDRQDALVRRFEITEANESVRRIELGALRANPTLGDQIFSFTPPAGTQVFTQ